jgi:hypothetical protein
MTYTFLCDWNTLYFAWRKAAKGTRAPALRSGARAGEGTHRALDRCQHFARRYQYVLQCDVKQFFPSIDHAATGTTGFVLWSRLTSFSLPCRPEMPDGDELSGRGDE